MPDHPQPPRILLIKFSALGDLVLLSRAILHLRAAFPGCTLDLVTSPAGAQLYRHTPYFERIDVWQRRPLPGRLPAFLRFGLALRRRRYDLLVDMQSNKLSGLLTLFVRTARTLRTGYGPFRRIFLGKPNHRVKPTIEGLLAAAGFPPLPADVTARLRNEFIEVDANTQHDADALLRAHGWDGSRPLLGLAPGSSPQWHTKRWPAGRFRELALAPALGGHAVLVLGDAGERAVAGEILTGVAHGIDLCGETTLAQLPALARRCALLVGNDSAMVHIAAAVGTPTLTLFGPTLAERHAVGRFYPGRHVALQADAPCAGKYRKSCDLHRDGSCLDSITVAAAVDAAARLLAEPEPENGAVTHGRV